MTDGTAVRDLELVHTYDADVARVYKAWSDPTELRKWWGWTGSTTRTFQADVRSDGAWTATIEGEDGKWLSQHGRYNEVGPGKRLVFTFAWDEPDAVETTIGVTFEKSASGTTVRFRQAPFPSEEEVESHRQGWTQCLDRLGTYLNGGRPA